MSEQRRRPVGVWVISLFYLFSVGYSLLAFYLVFSGKAHPNRAQEAYFASLGPVDWTVVALILACNVGGALSLFLLRKQAAQLFLAGLCISLLQSA